MRLHLVLIALVAAGCGGKGPAGETALPCDFVALQEGDLDHVDSCGLRAKDGGITVHREALARARFDEHGLTAARIDGQWFFVTRLGRTAPAVFVDNGTDRFVEGLARTLRNGKVGFVDTGLREVIRPEWDFAWPFDGGIAVVCQGCVQREVSPGSEYHEMVGGKWGGIDRTGRVVVPVTYTRETVPRRARNQ